jgi:hypothetical protein
MHRDGYCVQAAATIDTLKAKITAMETEIAKAKDVSRGLFILVLQSAWGHMPTWTALLVAFHTPFHTPARHVCVVHCARARSP